MFVLVGLIGGSNHSTPLFMANTIGLSTVSHASTKPYCFGLPFGPCLVSFFAAARNLSNVQLVSVHFAVGGSSFASLNSFLL